MKTTFKISALIQKKVIGVGLAILTQNWLASPNRWAVKMNGERVTESQLGGLAWIAGVVKKSDSEFDVLFPRQSQKFVITEFMASSLQGVILRVFVGANGNGIVCFPNTVIQETGVQELWGYGTSQPYVNAAKREEVTVIIYPDPTEVHFPQVATEPLATVEDEPDWEDEQEGYDTLEDLAEKALARG